MALKSTNLLRESPCIAAKRVPEEGEEIATLQYVIHSLQTRLLVDPEDSGAFTAMVNHLVQQLDVLSCTICCIHRHRTIEILVSTMNEEKQIFINRLVEENHTQLTQGVSTPCILHLPSTQENQWLEGTELTWFPIYHSGGVVGGFILQNDTQTTTENNILTVACPLIGDTLAALGVARQNRRRDLYEERAAISRELHDSLAQSLTYLKIQVARIQGLLSVRDESNQKLESIVDVVRDLRANLTTAYGQLRDLMTTFRLTMHGKTFNDAVDESIQEFGTRSTIAFRLDNRLSLYCLGVDEEMQVLKIIREALSNIVRHSHASRATIKLLIEDDGRILIYIEDDGVGTSTATRRAQHHGLIIMQERCQNLDGNFKVGTGELGGTKIQVTFYPNVSPTK